MNALAVAGGNPLLGELETRLLNIRDHVVELWAIAARSPVKLMRLSSSFFLSFFHSFASNEYTSELYHFSIKSFFIFLFHSPHARTV